MSDDTQFMFGCAAALLATFIGIASLITVSSWAEWKFGTDAPRHELETNEYMHCPPSAE